MPRCQNSFGVSWIAPQDPYGQQGLTLVELVVVMAIVSILAVTGFSWAATAIKGIQIQFATRALFGAVVQLIEELSDDEFGDEGQEESVVEGQHGRGVGELDEGRHVEHKEESAHALDVDRHEKRVEFVVFAQRIERGDILECALHPFFVDGVVHEKVQEHQQDEYFDDVEFLPVDVQKTVVEIIAAFLGFVVVAVYFHELFRKLVLEVDGFVEERLAVEPVHARGIDGVLVVRDFFLEKHFQFTVSAHGGGQIDQQDGVEDAHGELHDHVAAEEVFSPIVESKKDVPEERARAVDEKVPQHRSEHRGGCRLEEERRRGEQVPEKYQTQENREVVDDGGFIGNDEFVDFLEPVLVGFIA